MSGQFVDQRLFFKGLVYSMTSQEVQQNIEMGNRLLAAGQLADALTHYHNAIGKTSDETLRLNRWSMISMI